MPELNFTIKWPDGSVDNCYSPSTVIREHFEIGKPYPLAQFVAVAQRALNSASDRVEQKFGYHCSSAMDQLGIITRKASLFESTPNALVQVLGISQRHS